MLQDDDTVAWYPNDGTGKFPTKIIISAGEESTGAYSLVAADIDQDGFDDLVVASNGNDHVSLWRNDGLGNFTKTLIFANADFVLSVTAVDFDRDGDIDVASASFFDGHINWYENLDGQGYEWKNHTIYVGIQGHYVSTGDMDGDGDDDLIGVTHAENTVAVFFAQTSCDTNPGMDCCYSGTQWNDTACEPCPHGTYGEGRGATARCVKCPQTCTIPGFEVIPATCFGITGCPNVENSLAQCVCAANTVRDPSTDACTPCPEGQVRPDHTNARGLDSLGNYSYWEHQQGYCSISQEANSTAIIVGLVLLVLLVVGLLSLLWRRQNALAKSMALWTIEPSEIQYDDPVEVIGKGAFGEVVKGSYRGTAVAVKRALPPPKHQMLPFVGDFLFRDRSSKGASAEFRLSSEFFQTPSEKVEFSFDEEAVDPVNPGLTSNSNCSLGTSCDNPDISKKTYGSPKMRADFVSEMRHLAKLRHPNITTTMGAVISPGEEPMLVMEYMHNGSLYDAIRNDSIGLNSQEDILTVVQDVAHGLLFLHSAKRKVIHGDLKAKNVLIDSNFRAKVADFGLSFKTNSQARGTPYWMAPELVLRKSTNNASSDMYAFGILLYEVYSRKDPYEGEGYKTVLRQVCDPGVSKRPPVPTLCPPRIAALYKDCLEMDPNARPTAQDVDSKLQAEGTVQGRVFRIETLNKELAESNRRISSEQATQLAHFASMSHEIRTPLNCILGVSSLLEEDTDLNTSQVDLVQMIVSSGNLLRNIVNDVLDFSKFISGNAEIDIQRTDLQATLKNVISSMKLSPITERKKIFIQSFYDPNVPQFIETDQRRLQQILYNLLSNAVKFSNEESTIDLTVSVVGGPSFNDNMSDDGNDDYSSFMAKKSRHKLCISVKDYGEGIKESAFETIFQPFVQTKTGTNNVDGGTGLGLAITKQLTELLGGSISVDSRLGEWAEFSLQFPLTGTAVDTGYIISRLSRCCICLVSNIEREIQCTVEACRHFNVQCLPFSSLTALGDCLASLETDTFFVYLVQEDLYDDASYLAMSKKAKTILVTFGSNGKIDRSQIHYQSLTLVFPSALMQHLINLCDHKAPCTIRKSLIERRRSTSERSMDSCDIISYEELQVMVADDNVVNQKVFTRLLERLGVSNVTVVDNGQIAVDLAAKEPFDIIFMDIQMPVMDGTEACKRIMSRYANNKDANRDENTPRPPQVVFLSAHVLDDYETMCFENGAVDYMTKPCTLQDLRGKLLHLTGPY